MPWYQKTIILPQFSKGFHLITEYIEDQIKQLKDIKIGLMHIFIHHTSASLTINENADPTVREDFKSYFNRTVPEQAPYYQHTFEGSDDMPSHLKTSILGESLTIPVSDGQLKLGTWQGIYLCEHRNYGGKRKVTITLFGE